ncbi:MAG: 50S ribosomal protein L25 [Bacteroidota bacterium]
MSKPEVVELEGQVRETGTKSANELRDEMRVPAVLYGPEQDENIHFSVDELELEKLLSVSRTQIVQLTIDGTEYETLLKRTEFHPVTDRPLHADFYVMHEDHPVTLRVPVKLTGVAEGVRDGGGRVFQPMYIVRVKALPGDIPSEFTLDVTPLTIGDSLHISDLDLEGVTALDDLSRTIVTIRPPKSESLLLATQPEVAEGEEEVEGEELAEGEEPEEGAEGEEAAEESTEE